MKTCFALSLLLFVACSPLPQPLDAGVDAGAADAGSPDAGTPDGGMPDAGPSCAAPTPFDPVAADAGRAFLLEEGLGGRFAPRLALENLWLVWGTGRPADYWPAFRARYGLVESPTPNQDLPLGLKMVDTQWASADCLLCHAGRIAGQTVIGAANTQADLQLLIEDLKRLAMMGGVAPPAAPDVRTGARGVSDIVGFTLELVRAQNPQLPPIGTDMGFQDVPAWWTFSNKTRLYLDGSGDQLGHRTMMATLLAFGYQQADLDAAEPRFVELRQYLLSIPPPAWPFGALDAAAVERGRAVFRAQCVVCHGDERCERVESQLVDPQTVGTDAKLAQNYGAEQVAYTNSSWFGAVTPSRATHQYAAPSLRGVWASAPYLHNGSVPTLAQVLESGTRPVVFRVLGAEQADYDPVKVGFAVEARAEVPAALPRADQARWYDTRKPGLGSGGHTFGDALTAQERSDVLEFLKSR